MTSAVGHGTPRELLISSASVDGTVHAVVELGFFQVLAARGSGVDEPGV